MEAQETHRNAVVAAAGAAASCGQHATSEAQQDSAVTAVGGLGAAEGSTAGGTAPAEPRSWQLLWSDEFDDAELDRSKWEVQLGTGSQYGIEGWGNGEEQWYTDLPQNLRVENGSLVLQAVYDPAGSAVPNQPYTSARIRTFGKFAVGPSAAHPVVKVEARIKVPAGLGLWSAFWMLPSDNASEYCSGDGRHGGWAASGEIDIMEACNDTRRLVSTLHYGGAWPNNAFTYQDHWTPAGTCLADDFHTFGIEWEAKQMRWYVDGVQYAAQSSGGGTRQGWYSSTPDGALLPGDAPFGTQQFHILLNLALGAERTTFTYVGRDVEGQEKGEGVPVTSEQLRASLATPRAMLVQWVRVHGST